MYNSAKIMVVDDDDVTLKLIESYLVKNGYLCQAVQDSRSVLESARKNPPDLFVLDLLMPNLDGIQLCSLLKDNRDFKETPVIFLTAAEDTARKIDAFEAGAVDYITKPINVTELSLRIKTHLELFFVRKKLQEYAKDMERLAQQRAEQLIHADRLALLGTLSAGIAHEINNPATFISGNVQTLEKFWDIVGKEMSTLLQQASSEKEKLEFISREMPGLIRGMKEGVLRIKKIVDSLTIFARKEGEKKEKFLFGDCLNRALVLCDKLLKDKVNVERKVEDGIVIFGDIQQIEQVMVNLIVNAVDAMEKTPKPLLLVKAVPNGDKVRLTVSDNGAGVEDVNLSKIWDPFFTTKKLGKGTGLGLSIVRSIIENHGGEVGGHNNPEGGFSVEIFLPLAS